MKKNNRLLTIVIFVLLIFAGFNIDIKNESLNDVTISNIEALASVESGSSTTIYDCYSSLSSKGNGLLTHQTYCGTCDPLLCREWGSPGKCVVK